jgi:hypothetical protein
MGSDSELIASTNAAGPRTHTIDHSFITDAATCARDPLPTSERRSPTPTAAIGHARCQGRWLQSPCPAGTRVRVRSTHRSVTQPSTAIRARGGQARADGHQARSPTLAKHPMPGDHGVATPQRMNNAPWPPLVGCEVRRMCFRLSLSTARSTSRCSALGGRIRTRRRRSR